MIHCTIVRRLILSASASLALVGTLAAEPLRIAYSDWPGWTALEIGAQKGWFKEAGVDVELLWFEYGPSMEAFTAGKCDAVTVTNGDALVTGAGGAKNVMIMLTDFSNGNDMIVAAPGIDSIAQLAGKKVGIEIGFVEHLLLLNGLKKAGLSEKDVELVPTPTNQTPQVLASGQVDAIGAWQPNSGEALRAVAGSKAIYTSANEPGLIYDAIVVTPESLAKRRADWVKVIKVWDRITAYLRTPATRADGIKIMAARAGVEPAVYAAFMSGTQFLSLTEGSTIMISRREGFESLLGSSRIADEFNVTNAVYKESQDVASYIDATLVVEAMKK